MVFFSSILLPIDDPETPFNESDAPVSLATPVTTDTVAQLVSVGCRITIFRGQRVGRDDGATKCAITAKRGTHTSNSKLKSLFTLLC